MAKKRRKYKRRKQKDNIDLKTIGTIIFSVLLAVLLYTNSGTLGKGLNEFLGGIMGVLRYILPVGTFAIAIKIACNDEEEEYITQKLTQYGILLICVSVVMSVYQISIGALEVSGEMSQILKKAYTLGSSDIGGGAIGTLAAVPLVRLLGNLGAIVLSVGVSIMLFAFVFGIDISEFINRKVVEMLEKHEKNKEEKEIRKQERIKYNEARKAELLENRRKEKMQHKQEMQKRQEEIAQEMKPGPEQIKINLNGRTIEPEEEKRGIGSLLKRKSKKMSVADVANSIETQEIKATKNNQLIEQDNLFKQEEEKKEDKVKQVLQLEHTQTVEEDNYVFPSTKLLEK